MRKVLIVSNYFEPEIGAAPNRITNLATSFTEEGYQVTVVCPLPNYPYGKIYKGYRNRIWKVEYKDNIKIVRLWAYPSVSKKAFPRLLSMLSFSLILFWKLSFMAFKRPSFAIVQSPPLIVSFTGVFVLSKMLKVKTFLNVSDLWPKSAVELGVLKEGKFHDVLHWLERFIYRNSGAFLCQSDEIKAHISEYTEVPKFVYRNLPSSRFDTIQNGKANIKRKVVYAGLLGFAQGILKIVEQIDFDELGLEFYIYGKGMEEHEIKAYCEANPDKNVLFKGSFNRHEAHAILSQFDASLVPLTNRIYGAVPSKIFELIHYNVPILFSGGGEGNEIIEKYNLGLTCEPGNINAIKSMLEQFENWPSGKIEQVKRNLMKVKETEFDYQVQFKKLIHFIQNES